jgi:hypothetical protein
MIKKLGKVLAIVWITLLVIVSCAWMPQQFDDSGVSDEEYISIAKMHPVAQAFMERLPQSETYVDRSGALAVDFKVTKHLAADSTQNWEGIRLRVFINPNTNEPTEAFIQCNDKIVKNNLEQYLKQYLTDSSCP